MKIPTKSGFLSITLSLAALLIFVLSFVRESSYQVQSRLGESPAPIPRLSPIANVPNHGDYVLPYPGMLSTNPAYPLKMIRDRIGLMLTTNPERRVQLLLQYANKRIAAADELLQKGINGEAISTAIKAEIYLGQAINSNINTNPAFQQPFFDQLKRATLKHEEIVEKLVAVTEGENSNQATKLYQQLDQYRHQIVSLSGEPFGYPRPEDDSKDASQSGASPASPAAELIDEPYL